MRLAAGYMAQAYAEHVLSYQVNLTFPIEEAFRWGFDPDCGAEEGSDEWLINDMFDADKDVIGQWEEIKEEHVRAVGPNNILERRFEGVG